MPVELKCPGCGKQYVLADDLSGEHVACVQCKRMLDVPVLHPAPDEEADRELVLLPAPEHRSGLVVTVLFIFGLLVASAIILAVMVVPRVIYAGQEVKKEQCAVQLQRIGAGMIAFSFDHDGKLPYDARGPLQSLALLYPKYVSDPNAFACTSAPKDKILPFPRGSSLVGHGCSFVYNTSPAAKSPSEVEPDTLILMEAPGSHPNGAGNILCADGHVEWRENLPEFSGK